jgi:hypothetical protein
MRKPKGAKENQKSTYNCNVMSSPIEISFLNWIIN